MWTLGPRGVATTIAEWTSGRAQVPPLRQSMRPPLKTPSPILVLTKEGTGEGWGEGVSDRVSISVVVRGTGLRRPALGDIGNSFQDRLGERLAGLLDLGDIDRPHGLALVVECQLAGWSSEVSYGQGVEECLGIARPACPLERIGNDHRAEIGLI